MILAVVMVSLYFWLLNKVVCVMMQEPETEYAQPRVSPYRLAAHLTSAFVIYSGLLWTALSVMLPYPQLSSGRAPMIVRNIALPVAALVGITAVSGAFVAGNDAVRLL
jgi:cytochrome c oxidase assembly protein subunit 15